jgi:hypothetical protein
MARLELATRYRPVHIGLLLVCTAPPASPADDLYAWEQQQASGDATAYIQGLLQIVGVPLSLAPSAQLADLQRRGVYLARLVECPLEQDSALENLAERYSPVLVKRMTYSYKPRQIALLVPVAPGLAELLRTAGFGDLLIQGGQGIEVPSISDVAAITQIRALLSAVTGVTDAS